MTTRWMRQGDDEDKRDERWVTIYDDEAVKLMSGWTGGQSDPLYAISSSGGGNYAWVIQDALANINSDLAKVKKLGRNKYQFGRGTFTKAEIDELHTIQNALESALDDPDSYSSPESEEVREGRRREGGKAHEVSVARRPRKDATAWRSTPEGHAKYVAARAEAQRDADKYGYDYGLEANDLFKSFHVFMLPAAQHRSGHELRCEVVHPTNPETTKLGHGPGATRDTMKGLYERRGVVHAANSHVVHDPSELRYEIEKTRNGYTVVAYSPSGVRMPLTTYPTHKDAVAGMPSDKAAMNNPSYKTMGASRRKKAPTDEEIGAQYAQDQIEGDYFKQWVFDQMIEAKAMAKRDPSSVLPLETKADYRKLARNMLQQLTWDTKRDLNESKEFFEGFTEELKKDTAIDWLADELESIHNHLHGKLDESGVQARPSKRSTDDRKAAWMRAFQDACVDLGAHPGKLDWQTAEYLFRQGVDAKEAATRVCGQHTEEVPVRHRRRAAIRPASPRRRAR